MAPSSFKQMNGERGRGEGNYASIKSFSTLGSSLNSDLGLTLFPGSQIQREDEHPSDVFNPAPRGSQQESHKDGISPIPLGSGKLHGKGIPSIIINPGQGGDKAGRCRWDSPSCHLSGGRRTSHNWRMRDWRMQISADLDHGLVSPVASACRPEDVEPEVTTTYSGLSAGGKYTAGRISSMAVDDWEKVRLASFSGEECSSGNASAACSKKFGLFLRESYENTLISSTRQAVQQSSREDPFLQSATTLSISDKSLDRGLVNTPSGSQPLLEHQHSKSPISVGPSLRSSDRSPGAAKSSPVSDKSTSFRPRVRLTRNRVLKSWTSHFPKSSKLSKAKNYSRLLATSSSSVPSLIPVPDYRLPPPESTSRASNIRQHRGSSKPTQREHLPFVNNAPFLGLSRGPPRSKSCPAGDSFYPVTRKHQQPSSCRRTRSLSHPTLTRQAFNMESNHSFDSSTLPTPPLETESRGNSLRYPASFGAFGNLSYTQMHTSQNLFGHAAYQNRDLMLSKQRLDNEKMQRRQSSNSANSGNFGIAAQQTWQLAQSQTLHYLSQQFSESERTPEKFSCNAASPRLSGTWEQRYSPSSHSQNTGAMNSHQFKYKGPIQTPMDHTLRFQNEIAKLKHQLQISLQVRDHLQKRLQFYEQSQQHHTIRLLQRAHVENQNQIEFLKQENTQLKESEQQLLSQVKELTVRPGPNEVMAHNILQSVRSSGPPMTAHQPNNTIALSNPASGRIQAFHPEHTSSITDPSHLNHDALATAPFQEELATAKPAIGHALSESHHYTNCPTPTLLNDTDQNKPSAGQPSDCSGLSRLGPPSLGDLNTHTNNAPCESVLIDLTDESSDISPSSTRGQSEAIQALDDIQAQIKFNHDFAEKDLFWYDGIHPGRQGNNLGVNFGLDSRTRKPELDRSQARGENSPKKTKDVSRAVTELTPEQKEQMQQMQLQTKREKQAAYARKHAAKNRAESAIRKQTDDSAGASPSVQRKRNRPRQSAKAQKRKEQTRESPSQVQRHISSTVLETGLEDKSSENHISISERDAETRNAMELDALLADDDDYNQGSAMQDSRPTQDSESAEDDDMVEVYAAEMEAGLLADALRQSSDSGEHASRMEDQTEESDNGDGIGLGQNCGLHDFSESEESEEE